LGYGGGNNLGVKSLEGKKYDYFLILNNDTIINPDVLSKLIKKIKTNHKIAAISPTILNYYNKNIIESQGLTFNTWTGVTLSNNLGKKFPVTMKKKSKCICGACFLIKSKIVNELEHLFDEDFFCYLEDPDLCLRIMKLGYKMLIEDRALIYHKGSTSSSKISGFAEYQLIRNRFLIERKHADWLQKIIFILINLFLYFLFRLLILILKKNYSNIKYFIRGFYFGLNLFFGGRIQKFEV
jgi:hypothetical protein